MSDLTLGSLFTGFASGQAAPQPNGLWMPVEARLAASPITRDKDTALMIGLCARCGLRRAEVSVVQGRDVEGSRLRIHGKGARQRTVPLPPFRQWCEESERRTLTAQEFYAALNTIARLQPVTIQGSRGYRGLRLKGEQP